MTSSDTEKLKKAGAEFANKTVTKMFEKSKVADNSYMFPKFDMNEIKLGKVLGKGGFGTVSEIKGFLIDGGDNAAGIKKGSSSRSLLSEASDPVGRLLYLLY